MLLTMQLVAVPPPASRGAMPSRLQMALQP
jgi:hypothetical protein